MSEEKIVIDEPKKFDSTKLYKDHSWWVIISANMGLIAFAGSTSFIDGWNYFFLQQYTPVGTAFLGIIQIVYLIWDAINDPVFGYISDKQYKFTKKWGRRFPWIAIGMLPFAFSMWFIFAIPGGIPKWAAILWAAFALILYETLYTIIQTSAGALYPDKFRTKNDRKKQVIANQVLWFVGLLVGIFLPGIFFFGASAQEGSQVFSRAAFFLGLVSLLGMLVMLPGMRETPEMIERNLSVEQERPNFREFWDSFVLLLKNRNFVGYFAVTTSMMIFQTMTMISIPYLVIYTCNADIGMAIFVQMGYAISAVLFVPVWIALKKRYENKKLYNIATIFVFVALVMILFTPNIYILIGASFIAGIGIGGMSMIGALMYYGIIDEACVQCQDRKEGAYSGLFTFLQRIGPIIATGIVSLIQILTQFNEGTTDEFGDPVYAETQPASAMLGIRLHSGVAPLIIVAIGVLLFNFLFKLNAEKAEENTQKLQELGL